MLYDLPPFGLGEEYGLPPRLQHGEREGDRLDNAARSYDLSKQEYFGLLHCQYS
jgi:hypothetical protein